MEEIKTTFVTETLRHEMNVKKNEQINVCGNIKGERVITAQSLCLLWARYSSKLLMFICLILKRSLF